jgi:hypothetical protein
MNSKTYASPMRLSPETGTIFQIIGNGFVLANIAAISKEAAIQKYRVLFPQFQERPAQAVQLLSS